jgi:hypothetical protein
MTNLHPKVGDTVRVALEISGLLAEAESAQWQRSRIVLAEGAEDDPGIRGIGTHSDPTFDAVSDPARLALRSAVTTAEQSLRLWQAAMSEHARTLQFALDRWNGGV